MEFILLAVAVIAGLVLLAKSVYVVPQGMEFVLERFGQYKETLKPGLHLIWPFVNHVRQRVVISEQFIEVPSQLVISGDNCQVAIDAIAFVQVIDSKLATYRVAEPMEAIAQLVNTNIRSVVGSMELDAILSGRDQINNALLNSLDQATQPWGIKVTRAEVRELTPDAATLATMSAQLTAERTKRGRILDAQGIREAEILKAEGNKQSAILNAEGALQAAKLESEARERQAEAEAKSTKLVSDAIADGDPQALQYFIAQKYVAAFEAMGSANNSKLILMPAEMTSLASTVSGIANLMGKAAVAK
ncbi:SPFH domain-containing protein [Pseudomonas syringae pv. actinidiae]|nr:SPFH domain-containing protein [Pseudomonas syringae pv. actinidiae]